MEEVLNAETCYACELPACTVEHCPPKSFFPTGQRNQLLTVPSCKPHNNDNSKDVEYVRNVFATLWGFNRLGFELLEGKVKTSFDKSPALLTSTFSTLQAELHEGQMTGTFRLDSARIENVFGACARAIHYHDTRKKHAGWGIVMPRLRFSSEVSEGADRQTLNGLYERLQKVVFARKSVSNPQVFEYGVVQVEGIYRYHFVLYQSVDIYALPLPEDFQRGSTVTKARAKS